MDLLEDTVKITDHDVNSVLKTKVTFSLVFQAVSKASWRNPKAGGEFGYYVVQFPGFYR